MDTIDNLIELQRDTGETIQAIIRNFKKDPVVRKRSAAYFEERIRRLQESWQLFQHTDSKIRDGCDEPMQLGYFSEGYYDKIRDITDEYLQLFNNEAERLRQQTLNTVPTEKDDNLNKSDQSAINDGVSRQGLISKMNARMAALKKFLEGLSDLEGSDSQEFFKIRIDTINRLWSQLEELYDQVLNQCSNPLANGLNQDEYEQLGVHVIETLMKLQHLSSQNRTSNTLSQQALIASPLPLPKISIPKFDGDYAKWSQFYDIFLHMIHLQPIPNVQKMWYLKSHVCGDAERLIAHLSTTEINYSSAWKLLQERYNNKRILVATLVEKIINQPSISANLVAIKGLHDTTQECLLALNNLEIDTSAWDPLLLQILIKKLDHDLHSRFEQSLSQPKELPKVATLLSFLEFQFQTLDSMSQKRRPAHSSNKTVLSAVKVKPRLTKCAFCNIENHALYFCNKFRQLSEAERLRYAQSQKLCFNCLKDDHSAKDCSSGSCRRCNQKHNTLLHLESSTKNNRSNPNPISRSRLQTNQTAIRSSDTGMTPNESKVTITSVATDGLSLRKDYVLLATARVRIIASNGNSAEFRAILDSGSQVNLISEHVVRKLNISTQTASLSIDGIGNGKKRATKRVNVKLQSRNDAFETNLEAFVMPTIIPPQPTQYIDVSKWQIPDVQLADPYFYQPGRVDILLGAEYYFSIIQDERIQLSNGHPILLNTSFGWIISGRISSNQNAPQTTCAISTTQPEELDNDFNEVIENLWKMEEDESYVKGLSQDEQQCEALFLQHTRINNDGRFIVKLPFRENPSALGESKELARRRFLSLERRLLKDPSIRTQYIHFMKEYEQMGHMTEIDIESVPTPNYFIPHHCVLKPDSTTTKLRAVFDASAKTSSGFSLNDLMHTGPTVQSDLFSILIRFRLPRFVFTTDIEKMYRQILMHQDDKNLQLILWRSDPSAPLKCYQLNTVTYGTRAAPYLATKCLQRIACENETDYPLGAQLLKDNFYVDDGLGGSNSLITAIESQRQLVHILKKHGFNCRKWSANNTQLLQNIPQDHREVNLDFNSHNKESIKTLGLIWTPKTDHLAVKVKMEPVNVITKRTVISDLAKLFDPLGLLAPVVITAKSIVQHLWQLKLSWDEALPEDIRSTWAKFREDLVTLNNFELSRHMFKHNIPTSTQLHIFADASERAYGAAAYIRATCKDGKVIVQLLCSKSRVAPLKKQTVPRLELCAALLAAKLSYRLRKIMQPTEEVQSFLWTDSEIVLSWIHSQSSSFQTFVGNRISQIQTLTLPEQWRHVKSKDNPADLLSRGCSAKTLPGYHMWFLGPLFLHGSQECWPAEFRLNLHVPTDLERKKPATLALATTIRYDLVYSIEHKNSFRKLQRTISYVLRFIEVSSKRYSKPVLRALSTQELEASLMIIVRAVQLSDFGNEIKTLEQHQEIGRQNPITNLSPFIDAQGIMRVGGRLEAANLSYDAKHPMILSYNDPIIKLLFKSVHEENKHCGPQALLAIIRQRFWPIKGKITARATVQKCILCNKARPKLFQQIMGNLPQARVTPARPFINSGVDYFGPLWIHYKIRGKRPTKAYVAVFCCFATKAVHFELVTELSTEAFIGSLKRFIGRRGRCQNIYSDNATNFVGASNKLAELSDSIFSLDGKESIVSTCSSKGIQFHFIPPRAPHFGGLWEAAVKSAKHLLIRSVGTAALTYEELETVVVEIEAILNSRPLTPLSNNPSDLEALTPGHLLIGEALTAQVDGSANSKKLSLRSRWELVSHIKQEFWNRWSNEYLHQLQQKQKWNRTHPNIKPGDMVIIKEDNAPTMKWPLGRVSNVYPGNDGSIRVADIKTASGTCKRPIHRLALLPVEDHAEAVPTEIVDEDENVGPKRKRLKLPDIGLSLTLVGLLLIIPTIVGVPIKNERFGAKLGIHFEEIGATYISTSQWNMVVYYDLSAYWTDTAILVNGTKVLNHLCKKLTNNASCFNMIEHLQHIETDLNLENRLLYRSRQKRGAIDLIGNVAHSLFGILDSEYAEKMSTTIKNLQENDSLTLRLLKDQTSVINSTMNIVKQGLSSAKSNFDDLYSKINEINKEQRAIDGDLYQVKLSHLFNTATMQLSFIANNLQRMQTFILDALTDTHNGKINPLLLTPAQLQDEIQQIKIHMPQSLELPVPEEDLLELYKLMQVKGGLTQDHVVFSITIPLIDHERFNLYHLTPVPHGTNNTILVIDPCSSLLAINTNLRHFFPLSESSLKACDNIKQGVRICYNVQLQYNFGADKCSCEINLFNNKTTPNCLLKNLIANVTWTPLNHKNQWIYATTSATQATAVCAREIIPLKLEGSGLLTIEPDCILKHDLIHITGQQTISTMIASSYTSLGMVAELSYAPTTANKGLKMDNHSTAFDQRGLNEIRGLQSKLDSIKKAEFHHSSNSDHGITVAYSSLTISIVTIIIILTGVILHRKFKTIKITEQAQSSCRDSQTSATNSGPSPAPRKNFTVTI